jgi:uncharacterized protein (TIGR02271 family)
MANQQITRGEELHDRTVLDRDGDKIGKVADVFYDNETGAPEWLLVQTGLFGMRETFVPFGSAKVRDAEVAVPYEKDFVKGAPNVDTDEDLSVADEQTLARYYSLRYTNDEHSDGRDTAPAGADDAMTRSEEELDVHTTRRPSELVRLKKRVVTEHQQVTVPVQREEVRIEREPITDANRDAALSGPEIREADHEVMLNEEQVVVQKRTVPKERVRLGKDVVTEDQAVDEEVRKERIDVDHEGSARNSRP